MGKLGELQWHTSAAAEAQMRLKLGLCDGQHWKGRNDGVLRDNLQHRTLEAEVRWGFGTGDSQYIVSIKVHTRRSGPVHHEAG